MVPGKMGLLIGTMLLCFARSVHAVALGADCSSAACDTPATMVCDPVDNKCKVKADGSSTGCGTDNTLCPANSACSTDKCACDGGFAAVSTGLCGVDLSGDCSSIACATDLVCETVGASSTCKVKADGTATGCGADSTKCPSNSECYSDVCKCSIGYKVSSDLCVVATCTADSECTSSITNSMCAKVHPCSKGNCECKSGYTGADCESLGYEKTCDPAADKCEGTTWNLECPSGGTKCACKSGFTYKAALGYCTDKILLGEDCTAAGATCFTTTNAACDSTCKCSAGYYQDGQACRRPYGGETCTDTCVVVPTVSPMIAESSQQAPTCPSSKKCECGSNEMVSRKIGDKCYTVCLSTGGGTTAVGQTCTNFNDCESRVCIKCPDDANAKCYDAPCSGSNKMTVSGSIIASFIILLSVLF